MIRPEFLFKDSVRFSGPLKESVKHWLFGITIFIIVSIVLGNIIFALATQ